MIVILNSIFEYGFIRVNDDAYSEEDSYDVEFESDREAAGELIFSHYWEYMTVHFSDLETVRFINFHYKEAKTNNEKALGWLMLSINQP